MSVYGEQAEAFAARELQVLERDTTVFDAASSPRGRADRGWAEWEIRGGLIEAGTRMIVADGLRADARLDATDWVSIARSFGLPAAEIARLVGVSRQTVQMMIPPTVGGRGIEP